MKKISVFILFIVFCGAAGAQGMASIFSSMPDRMIEPVDSILRLDIIDLYNAGRSPQIINHFGDTARLVALEDNYLQFQSGNLTLEIASLPMINDSKVIGVIKTVCAPVCDSRVLFFTTEWKPLDPGVFINPVAWDWFISEGVDRDNEYFKTVESALDMELMQFSFDNNGLSLVQTYNTPQYLSIDLRASAGKYLKKESKRYTWNKVRFE
ncbi:MAG: DUF3256 family protein [Dysgonamonadaceae bacterium]|jgi:hypothetical protein|nr:DUF3256 family protein [Dysgonamonadaceae bacterium]